MTRLSCRQYPLLREFAERNPDYHMSLETAGVFDQRAFRSFLVRKWIAYRPGRGFHLTREGRTAWHEFLETEIFRKNPLAPLTRYFDAQAYGLARVHVVRRSAA